MKNRAGQEKKELWFNLIATGVVVGLAIVCPPAGVAAGAIYTAIDVGGAIKGEDLISGRKLSDEERLTRGAFAIVPGAGGLAAKSLLKHMPALGTVMKTVSKPVNDVIKPIKSTVDPIVLKGKQSIETVITKNKMQVSPVISNLKTTKQSQSMTPGNKATKHQDTLEIPAKSKFATQIENGKELGKAHVDQLKFAVAHPILSTVTSKTGQQSIRGSAKFIDNALRPAHIKSMEVIGGPKIPVGIELGPSKNVFTNMGEDLISRMQVKKDAIKGMGNKLKEINEVNYGDHFTKGKRGRKELALNVRYVTQDGYKYTTDELGRIVDVEVDNLILQEADRNVGMQRVAGREDRLPDDDGGHLIGSQFHGSGDIDNLVAQNSQINRSGGEWYKMESVWANVLKEVPPKKVSVRIEPVYNGDSLRPSNFEIFYKIEGKRAVKKIIKNQSGG